MPQNCCVSACTKKVYVEDGVKISYHKFPEDKGLSKKWIIAICRDTGQHFNLTKNTRVCSRHFKPADFLTSLAGRKRTLRATAVPSVFLWNKGSPIKRKSPKKRSPLKVQTTVKATATTTVHEQNTTPMCTANSQDLLHSDNVLSSDPEEESGADNEDKIREVQLENERLLCEVRRVAESLKNATVASKALEDSLQSARSKVEQLTRSCSLLEARLFSVERFAKSDKDLTFTLVSEQRCV